jgi:rod shape-determining protein MreC
LRALDAGRLVNENERLRALLGLGARLRDGFVAAEALHGPSLGEEHTMVLNQGTRAGVQPLSVVVAPGGIVGLVRSADANTSVAIVWPHPDFRVSAMAADGSAIGIVSPHLGSGASRFLLEWRGVPFRTPMKIGTLVISSGVGGVFPRGIPIGTVMAELTTGQGWERTYVLEPAVRPADAGAVLVLTPGHTKADAIRNAWATPDAAAATTRRVVTAGDSLRAAQRDSARAAQRDSGRAAVRDSTKKDTLKPPPRDTLKPPRGDTLKPPPRGDTLTSPVVRDPSKRLPK